MGSYLTQLAVGGEIGTTRGLFPYLQRDLQWKKTSLVTQYILIAAPKSAIMFMENAREYLFCKCHHTNDVASPFEHETMTSYTSLFKL